MRTHIRKLDGSSARETSFIWTYYLFTVLMFLSLFVVGGIVFIRTQGMLKERIYNELTLSVKGISGRVSAFIEGKKGRVLDFCSDGIIKDGLTWYDPDDLEVNTLIKDTNEHLIKNKLSLDPYLEDILILNLKGKVIFSTDEKLLGQDRSLKDYFLAISKYFKDKAVLKKLRENPTLIAYMSDFYFPDGQKRPVLAISNIITARRTGLPLGVLVGRYQSDSLDKLLHLERETMSESDKVYMINRQGLLLTVPKFFSEGADEVILKRRIESSSIIKAQENMAQIRGIYKDFRGERVLGASMLMEYNDWIILAEEDAKKVFAPLYRLTLQIIVIGLISLCAACGVSFLIVRLERNIAGKAKQLEESRQVMFQAEKMAAVGQISSSIAHEISNPLTGVLNNVQLMKMVMAEKNGDILKDYAQILNAIEESARRCADISRSLLDFSRASSGKFQPLSLNDAVDRAVILAEKEARSRNIFIEKELLPNLPAISGDFQLISQAIFDLVNNAQYAVSKADKKGSGWIFIKTQYQPQEDRVACIISDNGIGISEENLKKLFAPFFTTKPAGEGTGLGLSIVRDIIARHSGSIAVESQINKGTSFKVTLPAFRKEK